LSLIRIEPMGILDEAIREHLALKRRQGLSDDEFERLEKEAFGPPTRPGEPDFPDQEAEGEAPAGPEAAATSEDGHAAVPSPPASDERDLSAVEGGEDESEAPTTFFDQSAAEAAAEAAGEPAAETGERDDDEGAAPEPASEPPTGEEEQEVRVSEGAAGEPTGDEAEPPTGDEAEPPTGERELEPASDELDLGELELELDDEIGEARQLDPATDERETADPGAAGPPPPIESLDTVEHPIEEESREHEIAEPDSEEYGAVEADSEEYEVEEQESDEYRFDEPGSEEHALEEDSREYELEDEAGGDEEDEDDDDVLEETPEFLRDAPEDDELWFEQGEPKDFDF